MDRDTGRIIIVAIVVIVILVVLSDRGLSLLGGATAANDPSDPNLFIPAPDAEAPLNPESDIVVDPNVGTTAPVARPPFSLEQPASFASGVLHGLIAPITLVLSLIAPTIRMYDITNAGVFYDFGFLLGLILVLALVTARRWM